MEQQQRLKVIETNKYILETTLNLIKSQNSNLKFEIVKSVPIEHCLYMYAPYCCHATLNSTSFTTRIWVSFNDKAFFVKIMDENELIGIVIIHWTDSLENAKQIEDLINKYDNIYKNKIRLLVCNMTGAKINCLVNPDITLLDLKKQIAPIAHIQPHQQRIFCFPTNGDLLLLPINVDYKPIKQLGICDGYKICIIYQ